MSLELELFGQFIAHVKADFPLPVFVGILSTVAKKDYNGISCVENALDLLVLLSRRETVGVSEVSQVLGIAPSSAHRLLNTFCASKFATKGADRRYSRGEAFFLLGDGNLPTHETLRKLLTPYLEEMTRELGETSHLVVLEGCNVRFLNSIEANRPLRVSSRAGRLLPAHKTSCGKALLSEMSDREVFELYSSDQGCPISEVLGDFKAFRRQLEITRRQGFGLNLGENETGIVALSACIRTRAGRGFAALSLSMPSVRLDPAQASRMARSVIAYAGKAARSLGEIGQDMAFR